MFTAINDYLSYQGLSYRQPEKAGSEREAMERFKELGRKARLEMQEIAHAFDKVMPEFHMSRVSNWASQAQIGRPHFWVYFMEKGSQPDDIGIAIRLYGERGNFGLSLEVSFVERKKSEMTLSKQAKVLNIPIEAPLYYWVQADGKSLPFSGTEENRQRLQEGLRQGHFRKVLVKYDIPIEDRTDLNNLVAELLTAFECILPYYQETKKL